MSFQVRPDGWHFEDILFTFKRENGDYNVGASVRSKQEINSRSISTDVKDALGAQFLQPATNPFRRNIDRLALIAAPHNRSVTEAIRTLCTAAVGNTEALPRRIKERGAFSATARALYQNLDSHFKKHEVPADAATAFASFDLIELDMADFERNEPALGRQLCAELLHDPDDQNVSGLWEALVTECQKQKHQRSYIDLERILKVVRHRFGLKDYPYDAPDWEIIDRETQGQLNKISDTISGIVVARSAATKTIANAVTTHPVTAVVGPSGCGKSSILKQWLPESGYSVRVWTKASAWPRPEAGSLANALGLDGLKLDLPGLFLRASGPGLLVVDAVEHCVTEAQLSLLVHVIRLARPRDKDTPWRVVLLVRAEDWIRVHGALARNAGDITVQFAALGDFEPEDVKTVTAAVPALLPLVRQPRLETVLRKAKILSLVAEHVMAGGTMTIQDLAGESHLALWWWKARVRVGTRPSIRARAMEELVAKQAEHMQHAISEKEFEPMLLDAFSELGRDGICAARDGALAVEHDLYADWVRLQLLIQEGEKWIEYAKVRLASPLWHRAIRLYGIWLLEKAEGGPAAWAAKVNELGKTNESSQLIGDLFLEAPLLSAAPAENLRAVWPNLMASEENLLHRMLERMRQTGTFPNDQIIELLQREGNFPREELIPHFRLPYPQYWLPLLTVLHENKTQAADRAPIAVARAALAWLETVPNGWPGRRQAAELSTAVAKPFVKGSKNEVWFPVPEEEKVIYQALLAAAHECPDDVARHARVLCGLRPPSGGQYVGIRRVTIKEGFGTGKGVTYDLPPPWPGGPFVRGRARFIELVLKSNAMDPVITANPALARELLLAVHIPEREVERGHHRERFQPDGMIFDSSLEIAFYTRESFLKLLQSSHEEGRRLVVDLVNHFTDRWVEWAGNGSSLSLGEGELAQTWKGDSRLYLAYRGAVHVHKSVTSALMALEKYLLDRLDQGESIEEDVKYLQSNSRSLAIAGLLVAFGKKNPALLFSELWPFVASPELQITEFHSFILSRGDHGQTVNGRERQLLTDWNNLPIHRMPLHEVCRQCLPYPQAQPKLAELSVRWRRLLTEPEKLRVDEFTLRKLVELFDPSNWSKTKAGENEIWEYQPPQQLLEAEAKRRAETQSDLMPLLSVPLNCRTLLDEDKPTAEDQLESLYELLDKLPRGPLYDDDGKDISRPHLQTTRALFRRAAELKAQLGAVFDQLFDLAVWVAAARHVTDLTEDEDKQPLNWEVWWRRTKADFVAGKLAVPQEDWSTLDVGAAEGRHRASRFGPPLKIGIIVIALESLTLCDPPVTAAERIRRHQFHSRFLAAIVAAIPKKVGKSDHPPLPTNSEVRAMLLLGTNLAQIEDPTERKCYWEPLLSRGTPAAHYIEYFLQGFLAAGARKPTAAFASGWKEVIAWAEQAPDWKFSAKGPNHEMRDQWRNLLGFGGLLGSNISAMPPTIIADMKGYYERWTGHDLRGRESTRRFINFLRLPVASPLIPHSLQWLDRAYDEPLNQHWAFHELVPDLSIFLQWTWTNHERIVRANTETFAAFRRLLLRLAAEQDQVALALLAGITTSA